MAQIIIQINDAIVAQTLNDFCQALDYRIKLDDGTLNPETKPQFVRRMLVQHIKDVVAPIRRSRTDVETLAMDIV